MTTRSVARDGENGKLAVGVSTASESSRVLICLLGRFLLLALGHPVGVRSGGRTETLLSTLALRHDQQIPRDVLLSEVWPETDPVLASQALNTLVHSLHKLLGGTMGGASPVICRHGCYQLNTAAGVFVDVARFDEYVRAGNTSSAHDNDASLRWYERAIDLYRGDLSVGDNHFAIIERERLRARYLTLLARAAGQHFGAGRHEAALHLAEQLLKSDPCREDAHRLVMRCFVLRGERAQAMRQFGLCVRVLGDEFDAAPEPATIALFNRIRLDPSSI